MTEQRTDKEFEAFLAGESELVDCYKELGNEAPPPELDALILAEARHAAKIHRLQFGPRGGWLKPVALAATVLLAFSLVMNIVIKSPARYEQVVTESKESFARLDGELAANERHVVSEMKRLQSTLPDASSPSTSLPSTVIAEDRELTVEEITLVARKPEFMANAEPVLPIRSETLSIDSDAALRVVSEYISAAGTQNGAGRAEVDEIMQGMQKVEGIRQEVPTALAASQTPIQGKLQNYPDNNFRDRDENSIEDQLDDDSESLLRDIQRLNASGENIAALTRLNEFLARYPDHPVSVRILQQGY